MLPDQCMRDNASYRAGENMMLHVDHNFEFICEPGTGSLSKVDKVLLPHVGSGPY